MPSWTIWVLAGLAALGIFLAWPAFVEPGALVVESERISQKEFQEAYDRLIAQLGRTYAQVGQDFGKLLVGVGGLERRLELQARVLDDLIRKRLIARELRLRQIVVPEGDINDRTEIELERILRQNRLTEAQADEILKSQGSSLAQFKRELRDVVAIYMQTEKLRDHVVGTLQPSDSELSAYLEKNRDKYDEPEQVRARHILIRVPEGASEAEVAKAKQQIEQIRQELEKGADFAELAQKYSQDPGSARNGGDLGFFQRGQMVPEFEESAFTLEIGAISEPVRTQFGFHLIKVEEKKPARQPALAEIRDRVLQDYIEDERQERFEAWYKTTKAQAKITIREPLLSIYYLLEREQKLEEALNAYEKLRDAYQKAHLARVKTKQLLREEESTQAQQRKIEIVELWLAQMVALKDSEERAQVVQQIIQIKPETIPGRLFFHLSVRADAQELANTILALQQRLHRYGIPQSTIVPAGPAQLAVWLALPNEISAEAVRRLLQTRGLIELKRVLRLGQPGEDLQATGLGQQVLKDRSASEQPGQGRHLIVVEKPIVERVLLKEARAQTNPTGESAGPIVRLRVAERTVEALAQATATFAENELIAIVIDGVVYSTLPVTSSLKQLLAAKGSTLDVQIEEAPSVSLDEANALAFALSSEPLPTAIQILYPLQKPEERSSKDMIKRTELIPRKALFSNPDKAMPRLSPDGHRLAFLAPVNGVLNVWVGPADTPDQARPVTQDTKRGIRVFFWAYTNKHILYLQDKDGDENWRVYSVNLETNETKDLTPLENARAEIQEVSRKYPHEILILLNDRDPQAHDLYRVNIESGERELLLKNEEGFIGFTTDEEYRVRLAMRFAPDGGSELLRRASDDSWESFIRIPYEDSLTTWPIQFDLSGNYLYMVDSRGRNTSALVSVHVGTGEQRVLAEDPQADISDVMIHPTQKRVQAVATTYERKRWQLLDSDLQQDFEYLRTLADGDIEIVSRSLDDRRWIVAYLLDNGPVRYYLYERETRTARFLFTNRKALEGLVLAKMYPVVIEARDGLKLVSYLTLPVESDPQQSGRPQQPLPMVLFVHGGPWARDHWGYHPYHQWLANRGYAVLSVNFRGSTGFGKEFVNAGNREWGGKMHDDLVDAVQWAVKNKIADPNRIAIMGGSYGGYATLVGLTFTPDLFACGVDIVGPSNLVTFLNTLPPYWAPAIELFATRVGDHRTEEGRKFLESRSPLTYVDRIRKPLLIAQGANDPRVKKSESDQIVQAMQAKKIPVTYVLFPDEGHGFARPENNLAFNAIAEAFLYRCLGGERYEPIGDDFNGSSATVPVGADEIPGLQEKLR
ncbi:MAG: alpha/beta fold hydrolase [Candidatus Bipolaricaulota bacterium]|nr:alpha/beta fold hydrolase [Candidatus Bipolaricaulota bacterium]MDW8110456.1 prolyl oligopeptidase family serine peptidase [Candidatus Bipolaricaulota bacterium]